MGFARERQPDIASYLASQDLELKLSGGKWGSVRCVFHEDGDPSMRVNTGTGGWVCMSCGVKGGDALAFHMQRYGVTFRDACKELGCWVDDTRQSREAPLPFSARDALAVLRFEALLCAVAAANTASGVKLTEFDLERLREAASRIEFIAKAVLE